MVANLSRSINAAGMFGASVAPEKWGLVADGLAADAAWARGSAPSLRTVSVPTGVQTGSDFDAPDGFPGAGEAYCCHFCPPAPVKAPGPATQVTESALCGLVVVHAVSECERHSFCNVILAEAPLFSLELNFILEARGDESPIVMAADAAIIYDLVENLNEFGYIYHVSSP